MKLFYISRGTGVPHMCGRLPLAVVRRPTARGDRSCRRLSVAAGLTAAVVLLAGMGPAADEPSAARAAADSAWVQRALALQYELGGDVALRNAPWIGTHNSFNSRAEMGPTLSTEDSNQRISITDQLEQGIRSIELDLHWFPSLQGGGFAPVVCHATEEHVGCTTEKPLGPVLDEIAAWLRAPGNVDQVILLYLEDDLNAGQEAYDAVAHAINTKLGDLVFRPPAGGDCAPLPLTLTREQVLAAGAQVLIVDDCGLGHAWRSVVFDWSAHEENRPRGFMDFPDCGPDFSRETYESTLVRYYEDSTRVTATFGTKDDGITPETAARMARCGVDLFGLDQLAFDDPRLAALVWSWAPGEPAGGPCVAQRVTDDDPFGHWFAERCGLRRRPACRRPDGSWVIPKRGVRAKKGRTAKARCRKRHASFSVPRTGFEAQLLRLAMQSAGAREVLLGYKHREGEWVPKDGGRP
jgi:hypothetical protein